MDENYDGYVAWKREYMAAPPGSPRDYLRKLQQAHRPHGTVDEAERQGAREYHSARKSQFGERLGYDLSENLLNEPPDLVQTYGLNRTLIDPVIEALPAGIRSKLSNVAFGTLPTRSVNAAAIKAPNGGYVVALDTGFLHAFSHFIEGLVVAAPFPGDQAQRVRNEYNRVVLDYIASSGAHTFTKPPQTYAMRENQSLTYVFWLLVSEVFVVCHEIAHILCDHFDKASSRQMFLRQPSAPPREPARKGMLAGLFGRSDPPPPPPPQAQGAPVAAMTLEQSQEFEADVVAMGLYKDLCKSHPMLAAWQEHDHFRSLLTSEFLMIFQFLHLIDSKLPQFHDVAKHPPARDRVKMLGAYQLVYLKNAGMTEEQALAEPTLLAIRKHLAMMRT